MRYYPIFVDIKGRKVLVVGGGEVAERKVLTLLSCGADIYMTGKKITDKLKALIDSRKISYLGSEFQEEFINGACLVVAATNDSELNRQVSNAAKARNIFVNAVDQPKDCTFIVPSIVRQGDLVIAISTSGKSPALAKRVRKDLEHIFDESYGILVELLGRVREAVLPLGLSQEENRAIFSSLVNSDILDAISTGDKQRLLSIIEETVPKAIREKLDLSELTSG